MTYRDYESSTRKWSLRTARIPCAIAALALLLLFAAPGIAPARVGQGTPEARRAWKHHRLLVPAGGIARWVSRVHLSPVGALEIAVYVDHREYPLAVDGCHASTLVGNFAVSVTSCGKGAAPIRLKAAAFDGRAHRVVLLFKDAPV